MIGAPWLPDLPPHVVLGMAGMEPLVLSLHPGPRPCRIPVLPGGDGSTWADLEERTERCGHPTKLELGSGRVCLHHLVDLVDMLDVQSRGADGRDPRWFPMRLDPIPADWPLLDCRP